MYKYINRELAARTPLHEIIRRFKREVIREAVTITGSQCEAARLLRVHRNSINTHVRKTDKAA